MKKVKTLTIILTIALLTMIAFFGIYVQEQNRMENQVKDYELGMDFKGARTVRLKVSDETKEVIKDAEGNIVEPEEELTDEQLTEKGYTKEKQAYNQEDELNVENYKKSKKIIENRLENLGISYYEISLDEENGDIVILLPENREIDNIVSNINTVGNFEIVDNTTKEVLMDNSDIKLANVMYGSEDGSSTSVYLNIEFTKEGAKKLETITSAYIKQEDEDTTEDESATAEEESSESEETEKEEKKIIMQIDEQKMIETNFEEPIKIGKIQLSIGSSSTDTETIQGYMQKASNMANILDNGEMPVKYDIEENKYILSDITTEQIQYMQIAFVIVIGIGALYFIIKYRGIGILGAISTLGFAAVYVLVIRYANVVLSLTGVLGVFISILLNDILINKLLSKIKREKGKKITGIEVSETIRESYKGFFLKIIPLCISVIVFCFINWTPISSFGMIMFWGIVIIVLYNYIITNALLKIRADK